MEGPADRFQWFGEGFEGFPKILPDDCVQYTLYLIDAKLSSLDVRAQLREVQTAATALCRDMLKDFIWQREEFRLELKQEDGLSFLQGRTNFGDSVEDEWLIVYLLRELSKQYPQTWSRVIDSDGEFLLVEAADTLPTWLNPEVAENRVWISNGSLLIIPKERQKEKAHTGSLRLDDALSFIQERRTDLLHLPTVESEAFYRLRRYPAQIQDSLHQGLITIPRKLAYVLHEKAAYISPAVEAFYLRDPIALRPLQSQRPSKLWFSPEDFVTVSVKFTKVGFAQFKGQDFETPRAWTTSNTKVRDVFGQKGYEMGMKVTCGFEMLMSDPQNIDMKPVREINLLLEDLQAGEEHLPSDKEMSKWEWRDDDESWLDINFEDFEKELSGRYGQTPLGRSAGFGDKTAHENLRRMVSRFEKFLDDDDGAVQGAGFLDDMDNDNDSDNFDAPISGESEEQDNEKEPDFDEDRFASMMKEMMGLPATGTTDSSYTLTTDRDSIAIPRAESDGADEAKEIRKVMHQMETELRDVGALSLEPPPIDKTRSKKSLPLLEKSDRNAAITQVSRPHETPQDQSSSDDEGELDIDFERARELLDQFTAI
ncbi:MAG: hypothetical protein Q9178_005089 [Gyalolechia marmorata]